MEGCISSKGKQVYARDRSPRLRIVWAVLLFLCFCVFVLLNPYLGSLLSLYVPDVHYKGRLQKWIHSYQHSAPAGGLLSFVSRPTEPESTSTSTTESGIDAFSKTEKELGEGLPSQNDMLRTGRFSVRRAIKYFRWSHAAAAQLQRLGASTIYFLFYDDTEKSKMTSSTHDSEFEAKPEDKRGEKENKNTEGSSASREDATSNILSAFEDVAVDFSSKPVAHVSVPRTLMHHWEYIIPEDWVDKLPLAMIVEMERGWRKYLLNDRNLTYEKLRKFEEHYYEGTLLPSLRSEPAATVLHLQDRLVVPLVGETFKKQVVDGRQDALVFFYAPWCGFCKMFEPKWEELAAQFVRISSIRFFKMDVTKNDIDHPHTRVERVPYVAFYRRDRKLEPPLKMNHSVEDVVSYGREFILENATCREIDLKRNRDCFYEDLPGHEF